MIGAMALAFGSAGADLNEPSHWTIPRVAAIFFQAWSDGAPQYIPEPQASPESEFDMPHIKFKRVAGNTDLPLPGHATPGAAGMDLRAFLPDGEVTLERGQFLMISTGFHVELPGGTEMQVRPRSGLALKHGIILPNSPGTIDEDYRGVVMCGLFNLGPADFTISHGDRIAQAVIAHVHRYPCIEVSELDETERGAGGFGSTGVS